MEIRQNYEEDFMENKGMDFKIMIIDDNPDIHQDFKKILTTVNKTANLDVLGEKLFGKSINKNSDTLLPKFQIDTASQGQEGVEKIRNELAKNNHYSLAFVDIRMPPGWDGIETIKKIWELDKDIQVVICTAYSDYSWEETVAHLGKKDNLLILKKPFDNVSVRQLACALTKKWQLLQETRKFTAYLKKEVDNRTFSLQQSLSLIKATLESSDEGIVVLSNEGKVVEYNQKFSSMWDIPQNIIESEKESLLREYMESQLTEPDIFSNWINSLHEEQNASHLNIIKFKNGRIMDCYSQPQKIENKVVGRVLNFSDITERVQLEDELQHQALYDSLTGLPNRVLLLHKIREAIQTAERNHTLVAVMFLDLDRFKLINDSLGHNIGDELLKQTSIRLLATMRDEDTLARLGGDEFVILLTNMKTYENIQVKTNAFLRLFQEPFHIADREVVVTASIGISVYPDDGQTVEELLKNSDAAMYQVKESGSNNFQFYTSEMNSKTLEKLDREIQLRQALKNHELFLCYQPQFNLTTEKLIAVEALIRWNHPKKGVLLPMDFVPLAEETGLIVPIGEWILRTACKQNKEWQKAGYPPIRIAVNISAVQLNQQNFVELIQFILNEVDLNPEYLELELTENIVISGVEVANRVAKLKSLGISISIDDFGTGYSSLSYLKKLPLNRLKIDSSFVKNIHNDNAKDDEAIIQAIVAIAKNLHLEVMAEGVETQNQINFLKQQECCEIQGYYFSKPLSAQQMEQLFKNPAHKKELMEHSS